MRSALFAVLCLAALPLIAAPRAWTGSASANWSNPANWSPAGVPAAGEALLFPSAASNKTMVNDLSSMSVGALTVFDGYRFGGNPLTLGGDIDATSGFGSLAVDADLKLAGPVQYHGAFGFLLFVNGAVDMNGQTLTLDAHGSNRFNGAISGSGAINCTDIGAVFTHDSSFSGTIQCSPVVDGINMPNASFIKPGGFFIGIGTVAGVNVATLTVSGLLGGIGTLNTHALALGNGSYNVELTHGAPSDKTVVTGAVTLSGTSLQVTLPNGPVNAGDAFVIIDNDGADAVSGTFAGLPEGATLTVGASQFSITYHGGDGNDVVLTATNGAAGKQWTGGSSALWSNAANWNPAAAPVSGEKLAFPIGGSNKTMTNDLAGLTLGALTVTSNYRFAGNPLTLGGDISAPDATGVAFDADVKLGGAVHYDGGSFGSLFLNGGVDVNGQTLTLGGSGTKRLNGAVSGTGTIDCPQIGPVLTHDGTFSGTVQCSAVVDKIAMPNASFIKPGGFFIGSGTVGDVNVASLTVARELGGIETLNTHSLTLGNGSYAIELVSGAASDKTVVTGAVTLSGTALQVTLPNGPTTPGDAFVIIDNDGSDAVSGTFAGLPEGATLTVGSSQFSITYHGGDGNDVVLTALVPTSATLTQASPATVYGQQIALTATISSPTPQTPTGSVTFLADGLSVGVAPVQFGVAMVTVASLEVGSHGLSAVFTGSGLFAGSTAPPITHTVTMGATSTAVVSNHPASVFGDLVVFTVTVSAQAPASGTPHGQVTLRADGVAVAKGTLVNGVASIATSAIHAGSPAITVVFTGDGHFDASTSAAITQSVSKATAAVDARTAPTVYAGATSEMTVFINAAATGTIALSEGAVELARYELTGTSVRFNLPPLSPGEHRLVVSYGGDANFEPSSVTITQTVILPSVSIAGAQIAEGNNGITTVTIPVTLSVPLKIAVRVSFATVAGSATEGVDYESAGGVIEFAPGETTHSIELHILGDTVAEADETFSVMLSNPLNATIETSSAVVVIVNDDTAPARHRPVRH